MPARGDHEARRSEVARIASELIATGGIGAATHRRIAQAAGCSTTVVSHYFAGKRDLVDATYRQVGERVAGRLAVAAGDPDDSLGAVLEALLPLDDERSRDWRLLLTFLGLAATDAALALEQRDRAATARDRIRDTVVREQRAGRVAADVDPEAAARSLLSLALGIGMQALFDPADWPVERVRATLRDALTCLHP